MAKQNSQRRTLIINKYLEAAHRKQLIENLTDISVLSTLITTLYEISRYYCDNFTQCDTLSCETT